ncbi:MAG: lamin tail domain-containing protein, partial [Candidatus Peregrinibacteria bacterium]
DEWLEIACSGSGECDLSGWTLTSLKSTGEEATMLVFQNGSLLSGGDVRIVSHYPASSSRLAAEPWIASSSLSLPNTKLLLKLLDPSGTIQDEVDDGVGNPFAGENPSGGPKASMERIDLSAPGNLVTNWRTAIESVGFKDGPSVFGTPGVVMEAFVSSSSSESASSSESSDFSDASSDGFLSSSSDSFRSSDSSVSSLSSVASAKEDGSSPHQSSADASDGAGQAGSSPSSPSSSSSASQADPSTPLGTGGQLLGGVNVRITEVLANPLGADTDEWIEIGNLGTQSVNIAGWMLDDGNSAARYLIPPRTASGFLLLPDEYVSFRKSVTNLPLDNSGERVSLMSGSLLIDAWEYPQTAEEVSYGRDPQNSMQLHAFCVPSEGRLNTVDGLVPRIVIQDAGSALVGGAFVQGTEHVTVNLQAAVGAGSLASAVCTWDYGDDAGGTVCNPPSHTFDDPGDYAVRLTVRDFCGNISVDTLSISVLPEEEGIMEAAPSSRSSSSQSSKSSSRSSSFSSSSPSSLSSSSSPSNPPIGHTETGVILSEVQMTGDEWIELFNPTDHTIDLAGWILDDLKDGGPAPHSSARSGGGSKPYALPADTRIGGGEYRLFPKSQTKLVLNDGGDDVWLTAPDDTWSAHISVPKLKSGTSYGFCAGEWRVIEPTPGSLNACGVNQTSAASSVVSVEKSVPDGSLSFLRTRYVVASSASSVPSVSPFGYAQGDTAVSSGSFVLSNTNAELPSLLTVTGRPQRSVVPEVSIVGTLGTLGAVLLWLKRKFVP